jgi:hypothetical protein
LLEFTLDFYLKGDYVSYLQFVKMAGFGFGEWKRTFNECQAAAEQGIADERAGLKAHEGRAMEELSQQDPGKRFVPESLLIYGSQVPQFS